MDRHKGGIGLEEANWLVDQELQEKIYSLSQGRNVTSGELFRYALNTGIKQLEENLHG